ncbi:MAG: ABC transporter permease [Verrucomicrobia bacterium]|nr:ABC transporter permease [Verrucomicrobiota bacterium]
MISISNWFSQVASITLVNLSSLKERRGSAISASVGIAGVVAVLVGVLSIAEGFRHAMKSTGSADVALVLRNGADSEMSSGVGREETRIIGDAPGVARDNSGPLSSPELFVIVNLPKRSTGTDANVSMRGVGSAAYTLHDKFQLLRGRKFELGRNEIIVGVGAAREFAGLDIGHTIKLGANVWTVVGIFSAGGGVAESEIWTDAAVLQPAYHRGDIFQSVCVKLSSPDKFQTFKDALTSDPRLNLKVVRQSDYYAEQSTGITTFIQGIGMLIAFLMALGALFGALNTMYGAVSARVREIATLRAIGFGPFAIIFSILFESLVLALIGGMFGAAGAYYVFNGFTATTINWQTFSQVAFSFRVSPHLLFDAILWAAVIGVLGGLFPAIRAARLPVALALREI